MRHKLKCEVWLEGLSPFYSELSIHSNEKVKLDSTVSGYAVIFVIIETRRYGLGVWSIKDGVACRPDSFLKQQEPIPRVFKGIEGSALSRLILLLQNDATLQVSISHHNQTLLATVKPISISASPNFFVVELDTALDSIDTSVVVAAHVLGMTYTFKTKVVSRERKKLALALPSKAYRYLRRFTPSENLKVRLLAKNSAINAAVANFSTLGLALSTSNSKHFLTGSEIELTLEINNTTHSTNALVVGTSETQVHLQFSNESVGKRILFLLSQRDPSITYREDANDTWKCLRENGYLDLVEGIEALETDCINAWENLQQTEYSFMPVAYTKNDAIGTIGILASNENEWGPHCLATKATPENIQISASLYNSWPSFLLALSKPVWAYTWYDANKSWHNRFYGVFLAEHENEPEVCQIVRPIYVASNFKNYETSSEIKINPLFTSKHKEYLLGEWSGRQTQTSIPYAQIREFEWNIFSENAFEILYKEVPVGIIKSASSSVDLNPFSVFNMSHIYVFDSSLSKESSFLEKVAQTLEQILRKKGLKRASLTLDFTSPPDCLKSTSFRFFGNARCLVTSSRHLPALISNNCLSFAHILLRKKPFV